MENIKISVALAVYNEEKNLSQCLDSVKDWVDEIVIVDGGSTDKTVEIAQNYRAKVIVTDNPPIFHINKQKAVEACTGDWILQLDADEVISQELKKEIINILSDKQEKGEVAGFFFPRRNYLLGKWLKKGGAYPDYVIRMFKKGKGHFPCKNVHEQIDINGKLDYFKNDLIHNPYPILAEYLRKANTYTSLTSERLNEESLKISLLTTTRYLILVPLKTFLNLYLRHKGFMDGFPGFVWAFFSALHQPIAYIKYWEKKKQLEI